MEKNKKREDKKSTISAVAHKGEVTHCFEDADCLFAEPNRVEYIVMENRFEQIILIISFERWLTCHHLVHQHAQSPPVD